MDGSETAVNFQFRLLDSRDGKDIYEITRTVTDTQARGKFGRIESKGKPVTVTIEYAGGELVVFDDEYGVAKFMPVMSPQQEATEQQESTDKDATASEALKTSKSAAGNVDQADVENN